MIRRGKRLKRIKTCSPRYTIRLLSLPLIKMPSWLPASAKDHADGKLGNVGMPLRAALTGRAQSVGIFEAAAILGQTETCARIKAVLRIRMLL